VPNYPTKENEGNVKDKGEKTINNKEVQRVKKIGAKS
jgi:hypothetical protein